MSRLVLLLEMPQASLQNQYQDWPLRFLIISISYVKPDPIPILCLL